MEEDAKEKSMAIEMIPGSLYVPTPLTFGEVIIGKRTLNGFFEGLICILTFLGEKGEQQPAGKRDLIFLFFPSPLQDLLTPNPPVLKMPDEGDSYSPAEMPLS